MLPVRLSQCPIHHLEVFGSGNHRSAKAEEVPSPSYAFDGKPSSMLSTVSFSHSGSGSSGGSGSSSRFLVSGVEWNGVEWSGVR